MPLKPAYGYRLRRQQHPVGVRGGPRRAPRGYRLPDAERHQIRARYDLRERQLVRALVAAAGQPGDAAENLAGQLEQRLDALVHRAGFARTVHEARHLVAHNTFTVDGGKINQPSYLIRPGQVIQVRPERQCRPQTVVAASGYAEADVPPYLEVRPDEFTATLTREPRRQEVPDLREVALTVAPG
ncbi:30S ribosomal protein S4 [Micromonospora deserti]|uniref:30S ribosomal protein S4 n=1 Tax=Micromonospora deserti TaxID=2070366 RepID=UPI0013141575|nr:30S ribosomal protein S4 [Micromonospora deserti]